MRIAVVDLSFPLKRQSDGVTTLWLKWFARKVGHTIVEPEQADVIAATGVSATQCNRLKQVRDAYKHTPIVAGGAGAIEPHAFGKYADAVCVGDGQKWLTALVDGMEAVKALPNTWIDGETRPVEIDQSVPWDSPPIQAEDGAYRLMVGHGCFRRCAFCPTGWAYEYAEHPHPDSVVATARDILRQGKRVSYMTNDLARHSWADKLPPTEHASMSIAALKKYGLPKARQVRIGVEGVSERIRSAVGKPISHRDLIDATRWLVKNKKSVRWFMIAGLPHETDADWNELRDAVQEFKRTTSKGVVCLSFTAFHQHPSTPFAGYPVDDTYWDRFEAFREWFFAGIGFSTRIKLTTPQQPAARIKSDMAVNGLTEKQLRMGGNVSPNARVQYPHRDAVIKARNHYESVMGVSA